MQHNCLLGFHPPLYRVNKALRLQAFPDFAFAFPFFFALRSLFFNPAIPALQTSAYLTKNPSKSAGLTTVANLTLGAAVFLPLVTLSPVLAGLGFCVLPSVARTRIEPSVIDESGEDEAVVKPFWVRYTLPWFFSEVLVSSFAREARN